MKKPNSKRLLAVISFVPLLLGGVVLLQCLRRFPAARAHFELWRLAVLVLITMALWAVWSRIR